MEKSVFYLTHKGVIVRFEEEKNAYFNEIFAIDIKTEQKVGSVAYSIEHGECWVWHINILPGKNEFVGEGVGCALIECLEDKVLREKKATYMEGKCVPFGEHKDRSERFWRDRGYFIISEEYSHPHIFKNLMRHQTIKRCIDVSDNFELINNYLNETQFDGSGERD